MKQSVERTKEGGFRMSRVVEVVTKKFVFMNDVRWWDTKNFLFASNKMGELAPHGALVPETQWVWSIPMSWKDFMEGEAARLVGKKKEDYGSAAYIMDIPVEWRSVGDDYLSLRAMSKDGGRLFRVILTDDINDGIADEYPVPAGFGDIRDTSYRKYTAYRVSRLNRELRGGFQDRFLESVRLKVGISPGDEKVFKQIEVITYKPDDEPEWIIRFQDFLNLYNAVDNVSGDHVRWRISKDKLVRLCKLNDDNQRSLTSFEDGIRYMLQIPIEPVAESGVIELIGSSTRAILAERKE